MLVRMAVKVSGTRDGYEWPEPGDLIEVTDVEGSALVAAGLAEDATPVPAKPKGK